MENHFAYPLKYAEMRMCEKDSHILEAGCSAGQVLCCYYEQKYDIA